MPVGAGDQKEPMGPSSWSRCRLGSSLPCWEPCVLQTSTSCQASVLQPARKLAGVRRGIREFSRCQTSSFILLQEIHGFIFPVPAGALPSPSMRERVTGMDWELEQHWGLQHGQSPVSSVLAGWHSRGVGSSSSTAWHSQVPGWWCLPATGSG